MRYLLEHENIEKSLLFWVRKWIRYKVISLSSKKVEDEKTLDEILIELEKDLSLNEIKEKVKKLKQIGMKGVNNYFIPAEKLIQWSINRKIKNMREFSSETLMEFLTIKTSNKSDATKKNYRNAINNFFVYISKYNEFPKNSDTGYQFNIEISRWQGLNGGKGNKAPSSITEEEIYRFFQTIKEEKFINEKSSKFYNLLIRLLFYTGGRISEIIELKKRNIIEEDDLYSIKLEGKGNKERIVFIRKETIEKEMKEWAAVSDCENKDFLFCAMRNKAKLPNPSSISHKIADLLNKAGIQSKKRGAHLFRHTYATILYQKTKDLVLVQDLLGHKDPSTTRVYTHLSDQKKRESAKIL